MKTLLLTNKYKDIPEQIIKSVMPNNIHLEMLDEVSQENLLKKAPLADYILASGRLKINSEVLEKAKKLKMIQRTGVGVDALDLDGLKERGIPLYVNQGVNADSVAEHTVMLILSSLRRLTVIHQNVKNGIWNKQVQGTTTRTLKNKTVGLIGFGNIGQAVAKLLNPFGASLIYYDYKRAENEKELCAEFVNLDELYKKADIISLHCALTDTTRKIINKDTISKMKDGVIIVNTARGPLISENDLLEALKSQKVSFAGLDVFEKEPLENKELTSLENVIVTPHIAGVTYDAFYQMMHDAVRNISLFDQGNLEEIEKYHLKIGE